MRASSSSTVRGEFPRPARCCHISRHFHCTKARKHTRIWGLQAVGPLVPDRPHVQLILLDTKGGFGLRELDVGLPQLFVAPIGDVRAQEIGTLRERGPVIERSVAADLEAEAGRAAVRCQFHGEAGGSPLVPLQDTADLPVHQRRIEAPLRAGDARR